ncbi:MAG: hypothetical protein M5R41_08835 [Bacteroidia bacterium]|nr:hypothetical protein [Bacteroidia bacterium]
MFTEIHHRQRTVPAVKAQIPFSFYQRSWPLNPSATLAFTLDDTQEVSLKLFDSFGRVIHTIYDHVVLKAGFHQLQLYGEIVPPEGCYARLTTRYGVQQRTLVMSAADMQPD